MHYFHHIFTSPVVLLAAKSTFQPIGNFRILQITLLACTLRGTILSVLIFSNVECTDPDKVVPDAVLILFSSMK